MKILNPYNFDNDNLMKAFSFNLFVLCLVFFLSSPQLLTMVLPIFTKFSFTTKYFVSAVFSLIFVSATSIATVLWFNLLLLIHTRILYLINKEVKELSIVSRFSSVILIPICITYIHFRFSKDGGFVVTSLVSSLMYIGLIYYLKRTQKITTKVYRSFAFALTWFPVAYITTTFSVLVIAITAKSLLTFKVFLGI